VKTILIVDDHERIRELVAVTLGEIGEYQILEAENGEMGIAKAREYNPDLIFMDVTMPGKYDGLDATRILKDDPATHNIHIIMLTAKGQVADKLEGKEAGADGYFVKPFSPIALIQRVENVLE
jgi:two-component system, OmpR family, phosphate regulon response regulator PhoB